MIIKCLTVLINLLTTYFLLNFYNQSEYGILSTINSVVGLIVFFDLGINHGVKNLITSSFADNDDLRTSKIISAAYIILLSISLLISFIYILFINSSIQFQNIFFINGKILTNKVKILNILTLLILGLYFISNFIHVVLIALNKFHYSNGINLITQFILFSFTYLNHKFWTLNYVLMAFILVIIPIIISLLTTFIFFYYNKKIRPAFLNIDLNSINEVLSNGFKFVFIQIGTIILFQTNTILILTFLGPNFVSEYDIVYKIFSIILFVYNLYIIPFWSQISFFNAKKDIQSLLKLKDNIYKSLIYFSCATICLIPACNYLIKLWIGNSVIIHFNIVIAFSIYTISYIFQSSNSYILNGLGKIKMQSSLLIITGVLNIPLIYIFSKYFGLSGLIYANSFFLFFLGIFYKRKINKLIY